MSFKQRIRSGETLLGTWLTMPSPAIAEISCRSGFEWITVDLEHSCLTTAEAQELIRIVDLMGKTPLVRLSDNDEVLIKKVMDAGAHGVIVPMVKTLADVEHAHRSIHYPPKGNRGVGLARAQKYGPGFKDHWTWLEHEAVLMVQIEHKDALANLDAIFGSGLIDGYIIGPYDLSASLGVPGQFDHPEVVAALKLISEKADRHKVPKGIHIVDIDEAALQTRLNEGYKLIAYGVDFRVLESGMSKANIDFKKLR